jgi:hypothetical protein
MVEAQTKQCCAEKGVDPWLCSFTNIANVHPYIDYNNRRSAAEEKWKTNEAFTRCLSGGKDVTACCREKKIE